jgi:UDP:flavonoid glycosyltransferase YjiC (YdhE family)
MSTLNREREFVLCTLGTQGDISPFLAIGSALAARGHRVTILANEHWHDQVAACGAGFAAIAPRDPPQSGRDNLAFFHSNVVPSFHESFRYIEQRVARGSRVVVLFKAGMLGAQCAAEKLGLRHIKVALQPSAIRSVLRPAWPLTKLAQGRWGALARSTLIPLIYRTTELLGRYRRVTNAYRRAHGLRPIGLGETNRTEDVMLLLCPRWFAMPQSDWPPNCRFAGFAFTPGGELDPELREFIAARGPPLVFTPGTGVTDTQSFFRMASEVCRALAAPGIFLSAEMHDQWLAENILCRRFVDLGALLPRARLLLHHGGIGTTAQALRAGIPQIVMPKAFDQPDNAMRIAALRLGGVVLSHRVADAAIVDLCRATLADQTLRERLVIAARDIRQRCAATEVACLAEALALDDGVSQIALRRQSGSHAHGG